MAAWRNARLRTKALVALLAGALGVLTFALINVSERRAVADNAGDVQRLVQLSVQAGDLLHETQKERGRTAQMLGSKGKAFRRELTEQRTVTDAGVGRFQQFVASTQVGSAAEDAVSAALADLKGIAALRTSADGLATPAPEVIGRYTALNARLLEIVARTATTSRDAAIALQLQGYLAFLDAKERSGLERAQLVNAFSNRKFAPGQFVLVTSLAAAQQTLFTTFERAATPALRQAWAEAQKDASFADVAAMRDAARAKAATGRFDVAPARWFDRSTARINALKQVENQQAAELATSGRDLAAAAQRGVLLSILLATVLLLVVGAAGTAFVRSVTRPLREMTRAADRIAEGDLSVMPTYVSRDELGRLADAFRRLGDYVRDMAAVAQDIATGDLTTHVPTRGEQDLLGQAMTGMVARTRGVVDEIRTASGQLGETADHFASANTQLVANAEETAAMADSLSAAAAEMAQDIATIAQSADAAARTVADAVRTAERTGQAVGELDASSREIDGVLRLIENIAGQTHLLSLNASIEAARAGAAGRGFAVVAGEVKSLADQTRSATGDITTQVAGMQEDTTSVSTAIQEITVEVGLLREAADMIAETARRQTDSTRAVAETIDGVASAARSTSGVVSTNAVSAQAMSDLSGHLQELVAQFRLEQADA